MNDVVEILVSGNDSDGIVQSVTGWLPALRENEHVHGV